MSKSMEWDNSNIFKGDAEIVSDLGNKYIIPQWYAQPCYIGNTLAQIVLAVCAISFVSVKDISVPRRFSIIHLFIYELFIYKKQTRLDVKKSLKTCLWVVQRGHRTHIAGTILFWAGTFSRYLLSYLRVTYSWPIVDVVVVPFSSLECLDAIVGSQLHVSPIGMNSCVFNCVPCPLQTMEVSCNAKNCPRVSTKWWRCPPFWENGTWRVPSQFLHSEPGTIRIYRLNEK